MLKIPRMWFANYQSCRDKIREYKDESERLDQCSRLHDSSISNVNFELDASHIAQVRPFPLLKFLIAWSVYVSLFLSCSEAMNFHTLTTGRSMS